MKYCGNCGAEMQDDDKVCPNCGTACDVAKTEANTSSDANANAGANTNAESNGKKFEETFAKINDTKDESQEFDAEDINKNKGISVLSYFGILFLIPLFAAKDSKYAKYHVNQGLILFITSLILNIVGSVFGAIMGLIHVGFIGVIVNAIIGIAMLALCILGIVNAVQGRAKELPLIGKFRIIK